MDLLRSTGPVATPEKRLRFNLAMQRSRLYVYCAVFLLALIGQLTGVFQTRLIWVFFMAFCGASTAAVFFFIFKYRLDERWNFDPNPLWILFDIAGTTFAVHVTGGWQSIWFLWYLTSSGAAAFVAGRKGAVAAALTSAGAYFGLLLLTDQIHFFDRGFFTAVYQVGFLFITTSFFVLGTADLREKRLTIQRLREDDRRKVDELIRLTSELHLKSQELAEANRRTRDADRAKSQFLANMSHELRTPMNSIIGFSEILINRLDGKVAPKEITFLEHILSSGQHLLGIINDILDLSKIEAGRMDVTPERFPLRPLVESVCGLMRSQAARAQVNFDVHVPADFPVIESDLPKLKQILFNLLSNAIKFSPEQTVVSIDARRFEHDGCEWFELSVVDQGIGIAREHQELIFEEFRQIEKTISAGGTGLGLALVKRFVELLKGEVEVRSTLGEGSTFLVRLPLKLTGPAPVVEHVEESAAGEGETVLVVEDDDDAYKSIAGHMESAGYTPVRARRGDEALRMAKSLKPVAITLDIILPVVDGWEVLKQLKGDPATAEIPVVIISLIDNRELGIALGAHDYILKPVDRTRLIERLRQITGKGSGRRPRLLLIDDDPAFHALLETELNLLGYEVRSAFDGESGVSIATTESPDAIVLDILMPGLTGFQVAERLKQQAATAKIPIVVMTSKDLTDDDRRQLNSHVARFVTKGRSSASRLISAIRGLRTERN